MLGVKNYTRAYVDDCRAKVESDLAAYRDVVALSGKTPGSAKTIESFEAAFFANMVLVLDAMFMHRLRTAEGKDGNALNEVRVLCASILTNGNLMGADKTIKVTPARTVLKYEAGTPIKLTEADFAALSNAFFAEIERKFVEPAA